jgi:hypothetical protein
VSGLSIHSAQCSPLCTGVGLSITRCPCLLNHPPDLLPSLGSVHLLDLPYDLLHALGSVYLVDHPPDLLHSLAPPPGAFLLDPTQARNFAEPESLAGLSLGTILLATAGNGLMVPRALYTRDAIWLLGSAWGALLNWAQLLSMFLGRGADGCDNRVFGVVRL